MQRTIRRSAMLGGFILVVMLGLTIATLKLRDITLFANPQILFVRFGEDSQVAEGARVFTSGVKIGTVSDSFDCMQQAAGDVASGDLPPGIVVLQNEVGCGSGSDEGRAMMQIIHDLAPGAEQLFHTGFLGAADMAQGIVDLEQAGADVIVDDIAYFNMPFFQDGIIAQAADTVFARGVPYFSAAGNAGRASWEGAFRNSGIVGASSGFLHDFDPGGQVQTVQRVDIPVGATATFIFQWNQPFFSVSGAPGAATDLDFYITDAAGFIQFAGIDFNQGADALEIVGFTNDGSFDADGIPGPDESFGVAVELFAGPEPSLMKYVIFGGSPDIVDFDTQSPTLFGHPNANGAEAVGAAAYFETPAFGTTPPLLEPFSAAGGIDILFTTSGASTVESREKPEIVAPDGVNTTFFFSDFEPDGFPNFFGTSAAAPHAAAVAALLLERNANLTPSQVYEAMEVSALDMGTPGVDPDSGHGLVRADATLDTQSRCSQPVTAGDLPTASDCLFILKIAVGPDECSPACICDTDASGRVTATDTLICLKVAVGQSGPRLNCPC